MLSGWSLNDSTCHKSLLGFDLPPLFYFPILAFLFSLFVLHAHRNSKNSQYPLHMYLTSVHLCSCCPHQENTSLICPARSSSSSKTQSKCLSPGVASPQEWPLQFLPQAGVMTLSFTVDSSQNHLRNIVLKHLHLLWEQTGSDFCSLADNMTSKGKVHRHFSAFNSQRHESMLFAHQNSQKLILFPCVLLAVFI